MNAPCLFVQRLGVDNLETQPHRTMREIAEDVAARHGVTVVLLRSPLRFRKLAWPRQEAMALMYAQGRYSHPQIGRYFGRDHTTVIYGVKAHAKRQEEARLAEQARAG